MALVILYLKLMYLLMKITVKTLSKLKLIYPVIYLFMYSCSIRDKILLYRIFGEKLEYFYYPLLIVSFIPFIKAFYKNSAKTLDFLKYEVVKLKNNLKEKENE